MSRTRRIPRWHGPSLPGNPSSSAGCDSALRDNQRNVFGDAILTPHLQDVLHDSRFQVKRVPVVRWSEAIDEERIVFEGHEREILKMSMGLQVIDESAQPGSPALVVRPKGDVFIDAFENRATQLSVGSQLVDGIRPLAEERTIVLRHGVLTVAFLPDLNSHHRITALVDVRNLIGAILGRVINRRAGNQRRVPHGQPTGKEIVYAVVLVVAAGDQITGFVPGVDRRSAEGPSGIFRRPGKSSARSRAVALTALAPCRRTWFHTLRWVDDRIGPPRVHRPH